MDSFQPSPSDRGLIKMSIAANVFSQNVQFTGLVETDIGIPEAGICTVDVKCTIPTLVSGGGVSALVIVIKEKLHN